MAAGIVPVCPYHRKPSSVCSGGFFGSQGGGASGARRVAGRSGFRSADSHCGVFRTGRPNNCRCNSSPHATSVRPTRRADMRARPLICHRHTAGREWHASISPAGGGGWGFKREPPHRVYNPAPSKPPQQPPPPPWAQPHPHHPPSCVFTRRNEEHPRYLPRGDLCHAPVTEALRIITNQKNQRSCYWKKNISIYGCAASWSGSKQ